MNYPERPDLHQGKFSDGDPVVGIAASVISAEQINALYDEMIAVIEEGGLTQNENVLSQLAQSVKNQIRGEEVLTTRGDANQIVLTTPAGKQPVKVLRDYDKIHFRVGLSNTESNVTLAIDGLAQIAVSSITGANQLLKGALATVTYLDESFWLTRQINPKTGNSVDEIGNIRPGTTSVLMASEVEFNGAEKKRDGSFLWLKALTGGQVVDQSLKDGDYEKYAGYYGTGDGLTTFTMPEHRGEYYRNWDNGRGVDSERELSEYKKGSIAGFDTGVDGIWNISTTDQNIATANETLGLDSYDDSQYPSGRLTASNSSTTNVLPGVYGNQGGSGAVRVRSISVFAKTVE